MWVKKRNNCALKGNVGQKKRNNCALKGNVGQKKKK